MDLKEFLTPENVVVFGANALGMYIGYILFRAKVNRDVEEMKKKIEQSEKEIKQLALATQETRQSLAVLNSQFAHISQQLAEMRHDMKDQLEKIFQIVKKA